jgi:hypothetical protein
MGDPGLQPTPDHTGVMNGKLLDANRVKPRCMGTDSFNA